jgi:GNAT superfamily N-acetyltransferase
MRGDYALHRRGDAGDADTVGVACFAVALPYRRHGLAQQLLHRVLADAPARGASAVEAYPVNEGVPSPSGFRGSRAMYEAAGFTPVAVRQRDTVVRRTTG